MYKGLVCLVLEYGSLVWGSFTLGLQEEVEKAQTGKIVYNYEDVSMTDILGQLKLETLKNRRKDNRLTCILLYKGLKGKARISTDLITKTRYCNNESKKYAKARN